jgi:hypothetical protein
MGKVPQGGQGQGQGQAQGQDQGQGPVQGAGDGQGGAGGQSGGPAGAQLQGPAGATGGAGVAGGASGTAATGDIPWWEVKIPTGLTCFDCKTEIMKVHLARASPWRAHMSLTMSVPPARRRQAGGDPVPGPAVPQGSVRLHVGTVCALGAFQRRAATDHFVCCHCRETQTEPNCSPVLYMNRMYVQQRLRSRASCVTVPPTLMIRWCRKDYERALEQRKRRFHCARKCQPASHAVARPRSLADCTLRRGLAMAGCTKVIRETDKQVRLLNKNFHHNCVVGSIACARPRARMISLGWRADGAHTRTACSVAPFRSATCCLWIGPSTTR